MKCKIKGAMPDLVFNADINMELTDKTNILHFDLLEDTNFQPRYLIGIKWDMLIDLDYLEKQARDKVRATMPKVVKDVIDGTYNRKERK